MIRSSIILFVLLLVHFVNTSPRRYREDEHKIRHKRVFRPTTESNVFNSDESADIDSKIFDDFEEAIDEWVSDLDKSDSGNNRHRTGTFGESSNEEHFVAKKGKSKEPCVGCAKAKSEEYLSEEQIRQERIEMIKEQILMKLRLKEPPNVSLSASNLPKPLAEGILPQYHLYENGRIGKNVDDFYGKTEQVIVFPENVTTRCRSRNGDPVACFEFELPAEVNAEDITTAQLWFYKLKDNNDRRNQSFVIHYHRDVAADHNYINEPMTHVTTQEVDIKEGWMKFDIHHQMYKWIDRRYLRRVIQISCKTCAMEQTESPVGTDALHRPFIIINTSIAKKKSRTRRQINCAPGITECCRESLYISFKELGWETWVLQPAGYSAYFCKGSCSAVESLSQTRLEHTSILQRYYHAPGGSSRHRRHISFCCTPTQMSEMSLIYLNESGNVVQMNLPNMIVNSCGCM